MARPSENQRQFLGPDAVVLLGRGTGVVLMAVAIAVGVWRASQAGGDQAWFFISAAIMPLSFSFLVLLTTEGVRSRSPHANVMLLGRAAAAIVLAAALALALRAATDADSDRLWAFLGTLTFPAGLGLLVLVAAESLRRPHIDPLWANSARTSGGVVIAAALAFALWALSQADTDHFWVFLRAVVTPSITGAVLLVAGEALSSERGHSSIVLFGRIGALVALGGSFAMGIEFAAGAGTDYLWWFLLIAATPVGISLLLLAYTQALQGGGALYLGRLSGLAVVVFSIAVSVWIAREFGRNEVWWFLFTAATPVAAGCALLITTERTAAPSPSAAGRLITGKR